MAHARDAARTYGKSDPIDALAVARAALRHEDLPVAQLDGPTRELRLLVDHREDLVNERTRCINRLRWHLHELDPSWDPTARSLTSYCNIDAVTARLGALEGMVARIAGDIAAHIRDLTVQERALEREITQRVRVLAPSLLGVVGVGALTAAKIIAEVADVRRFRSKDAFARHNGTAPLPVWSSNHPRHRLARTGNRQLNAAIHRIAVTQIRLDGLGKRYYEKKKAEGMSTPEALRCLKRRLARVVFTHLTTDQAASAAGLAAVA